MTNFPYGTDNHVTSSFIDSNKSSEVFDENAFKLERTPLERSGDRMNMLFVA